MGLMGHGLDGWRAGWAVRGFRVACSWRDGSPSPTPDLAYMAGSLRTRRSRRIQHLPDPGLHLPGDVAVPLKAGDGGGVIDPWLPAPSYRPGPLGLRIYGRCPKQRPALGREEHHLLIHVHAHRHPTLVHRPVMPSAQ
jgi:hypothetical protein